MCKSPLHPLLATLPKCEHHMHLEGALRPDVLFALAAQKNHTFPPDDPAFASPEALAARYRAFTSLDDFLHYYYLAMAVLQTAADFEALAWDYFARAAADGVVHAEVFFDPQAHVGRGVGYAVIVEGFGAARRRAERELGVSSELICCFLRHLPAAQGVELLRSTPGLRADLASGEICGIGLDSSEREFPPEGFAELYVEARRVRGDLRLTAHAGEEGPAEYIRAAMEKLGVERIDHGVRLREDGDLLERVAREGTMLTVCPFSNLLLRCVGSMEELPIRLFLEKGVKFSINSDDPAYFGGHYILDNYCAVQEAFGLKVEEWNTVATNAIQGSWCSEDRKAVLLKKLSDVIGKWKERNVE